MRLFKTRFWTLTGICLYLRPIFARVRFSALIRFIYTTYANYHVLRDSVASFKKLALLAKIFRKQR